MGFSKIDTTARPPRLWALVGYPGSGKSTFAAAMDGPILAIDADHRFSEVAKLSVGDVYEISKVPSDHVDADRIAKLLTANMPGSGVRTVVIDSLTAIIAPLVTAAVMGNDAGENKNRVSAFKAKAMALRLLQDSITRWGCDTLWIYHLQSGLDGNARQQVTTTVSAVELARLRRSLNMQLRMVKEGDKRGVIVDWARRGRQGMTIWDETEVWRGMPERIEVAVYDGLSEADQEAIGKRIPSAFASVADAIAWGWESGTFEDAVHTQNAYDKLKAQKKPLTSQQMWDCWAAYVTARIEQGETEDIPASGDGTLSFHIFQPGDVSAGEATESKPDGATPATLPPAANGNGHSATKAEYESIPGQGATGTVERITDHQLQRIREEAARCYGPTWAEDGNEKKLAQWATGVSEGVSTFAILNRTEAKTLLDALLRRANHAKENTK